MTSDDDLRARLRGADPARDLPESDPARAELLLQDVMATELTTENRATGTRHRSRLTWMVAAAAVLVIVGGAAVAGLVLTGGEDDPVASPGPATSGATSATSGSPSPSAGGTTRLSAPAAAAYSQRCMAPTAQALGAADIALDGTVTEVADGRVTLAPGHWYAGEPTATVEVTAPARDLGRLETTLELQEGERYLISAMDGRVAICGFSGPYDETLASLYTQAFGG